MSTPSIATTVLNHPALGAIQGVRLEDGNIDQFRGIPGALCLGSNAWPQYDLVKFVKHSLDHGKPVIGVSINYRVGIFGFLASARAGLRGNYGLKDQACAFRWIQQNIGGFGGDPSSITAFGESAGGITLSTLLATSDPLFHRALLMSGDITVRRPQSMAWQEAMLRENLTYLGLDDLDAKEAVNKLRLLPASDIVQMVPMVQHWSATLDEDFLPGLRAADLTITNTWCKSILTGDMAHDGTILRSRYLDKADAKDSTIVACNDILGSDLTQKVRAAYLLDTDKAATGMLLLASELRFYAPVLAAGKGFGLPHDIKVRQYHMDQTNPLPGGTHGFASHALDIAYLLRNFEPWLTREDVELSKRFAEAVLEFAHDGKRDRDDVIAVGPDHKLQILSAEQYDAKYRDDRGKLLAEIGWKKCLTLGERLQGFPYPELDYYLLAQYGVKVLDLSRVLAGPYCTQILGDMGADILKVEHPVRGDDTRSWGPPYAPRLDGADSAIPAGESAYYLSVNRNKKSLALSFKEKQGADILRELAKKVDVVVENYLPGSLKKYGLDYETLRKLNPKLIYASITGYGQFGPYSDRAGYDVMVEAEMGLMHITGPRDGPPVKVGCAVTDLTTGMYATTSILASLLERNRSNLVLITKERDSGRWGTAHPSVVPYRAFKSSDGDILFGGGNDRLFAILAKGLGRPEWATDDRFATNSARVKHRAVLEKWIEEVTRTKTTQEWLDIFDGTGLPYAKVNDLMDTTQHRHERNLV
ncbi:Succinate--hydroxymethylglutarate CoA-transferase like protein [Verticillium longisporum]|uniref:Succinate--hydroxymethylglutarate CoA-transferase like protein n=1 Tax=Verticillium longisporum TaxID=100787 RepID=A0A8I2ZCF3_VERLO|nr:Succinate--hydroxymethylglutarate CoA-transferase like protein [Verticillium longisporum]